METKFEFKATGGELFKALLGGLLLSGLTFGIYYPWFMVRFQKLLLERTEVQVGDRPLALTTTATGGALFKEVLITYLLTMVTFGVYLPWGVVRLMRFWQAHTVAQGTGVEYHLKTELTGGQVFKAGLVGYLLTAITFGIYGPWLLVKLAALFLDHTRVEENGQPSGQLHFRGTGGALFKTALVGGLLTMVTFGIYAFWFQVKILRYWAEGTELSLGEERYRADYQGQGLELLKIGLLGYWLTGLTLGIYGFWFVAKLLRYQAAHFRVIPLEPASAAANVELPVRQSAVPTALVRAQPLAPAFTAPNAVAVERGTTTLPDPVVPAPSKAPAPARVLSVRPAAVIAPARKASVPRALPAPRPAASLATGDRRAAWAKAFLPLEAPAIVGEDAQATMPHSMSLEQLAEVWTDSAEPLAPRSLN